MRVGFSNRFLALTVVGSDVSKGNYRRPDDGPSFANDVRKEVSYADVVKRSAVNNV